MACSCVAPDSGKPALFARAAAAPQDENADMLREALSCSLKLPSMDDMGDIDDDGRPISKKT